MTDPPAWKPPDAADVGTLMVEPSAAEAGNLLKEAAIRPPKGFDGAQMMTDLARAGGDFWLDHVGGQMWASEIDSGKLQRLMLALDHLLKAWADAADISGPRKPIMSPLAALRQALPPPGEELMQMLSLTFPNANHSQRTEWQREHVDDRVLLSKVNTFRLNVLHEELVALRKARARADAILASWKTTTLGGERKGDIGRLLAVGLKSVYEKHLGRKATFNAKTLKPSDYVRFAQAAMKRLSVPPMEAKAIVQAVYRIKPATAKRRSQRQPEQTSTTSAENPPEDVGTAD